MSLTRYAVCVVYESHIGLWSSYNLTSWHSLNILIFSKVDSDKIETFCFPKIMQPFLSFDYFHEQYSPILTIDPHILPVIVFTSLAFMFHFMFVHYTFSSVWVAEWPPFGK